MYESRFNGLRSFLESASTLRNQNAAHGQGLNKTQIDDYVMEYFLDGTASTLKFLIKAEQNLK